MDLGLGDVSVKVAVPALPTVSMPAPSAPSVIVVPGGGGGVSEDQVLTLIGQHVDDPTPHPAYDVDMPRLDLIYENGLI